MNLIDINLQNNILQGQLILKNFDQNTRRNFVLIVNFFQSKNFYLRKEQNYNENFCLVSGSQFMNINFLGEILYSKFISEVLTYKT